MHCFLPSGVGARGSAGAAKAGHYGCSREVRLKPDTTTVCVASGFSRTAYVASGFSRTAYVVSGFSRTEPDV